MNKPIELERNFIYIQMIEYAQFVSFFHANPNENNELLYSIPKRNVYFSKFQIGYFIFEENVN